MRRLEGTFRKCTKNNLDYKQKYALSEFIFGGFIHWGLMQKKISFKRNKVEMLHSASSE